MEQEREEEREKAGAWGVSPWRAVEGGKDVGGTAVPSPSGCQGSLQTALASRQSVSLAGAGVRGRSNARGGLPCLGL